MPIYNDRKDAGQILAQELTQYKGRDDVVILALPPGGVPVAYEVAKALDLPLDVFIVRKLGVPGQPELAMGAIASGGVQVMNEDVVRRAGISERQKQDAVEKEKRELCELEETYRGGRPDLNIKGKTVLLIDEGMATGASMRAAVSALKQLEPEEIVIAVPTGPPGTCEAFESEVDVIFCLRTPKPFRGVGGSYIDFSQTTNESVREYLDRAQNLDNKG